MMICPNCQTELKIADRSGVEIDYCPQCRGVWLDRGELDKIIERSVVPAQAPRYDEKLKRDFIDDDDRYDNDRYDNDYKDKRAYEKKRRKSFFEDLFDFD